MADKQPDVLAATDPTTIRHPHPGVAEVFVRRWSPRSLAGEALTEADLLPLFEAARWAPSSYNNQPWRFLYALRGSQHWPTFVGLLGDFNRKWAGEAGALVVVLSKTTFDHNGEPARTHSFDTGAAWENLALQASLRHLVAHGMQGFDYDRAREVLGVPDDHQVEAMVALGRPAPRERLAEDLRKREAPSPRKPLAEIAWAGPFRRNPG
jgi:nitroreductase